MNPIQLSAMFFTTNGGAELQIFNKVYLIILSVFLFYFININSLRHFYFTHDQIVSIGLKYELEGGINKHIPPFCLIYSVTILL